MNKRITKKRTRQLLYPQITYLLEEYSLKDILRTSHKAPVNKKDIELQYVKNKNNRKVVVNLITSQKVHDKCLAHLYHKVHHIVDYVMFPNELTVVELTPSAHHYLQHLFHHMNFNSLLGYAVLSWDLDKDSSYDLRKHYRKWVKESKSKNA